MVDLIQVGVQSGGPCSGPDGQRTGVDLGQSLSITDNFHFPAHGVQQCSCVTEDLVSGVILQGGTCDGEGNLQGAVACADACFLHVLLDIADGNCLVPGAQLGIIETVVRTVSAVGMCPGNQGHGPVNLRSGTGTVVVQCQCGVHGAHDGLTQVDVVDLGSVDTDVAVAQLVGGQGNHTLGFQSFQLLVVVGGQCGRDVVDSAVFQRCDCVLGGNHLIADLLDLGILDAFANGAEVLVCLEVDNVVHVEGGLGRIAVFGVGCLISAGTHGDLDVSGGLDDVGHELEGSEFHTELVVGDVHSNGAALAVVVLGSDGQCEVPDCLGVDAVDGNLQHIVLALVCDSAVGIVSGCDLVIGAVDGDGGTGLIGVAQRNDTGNVLDSQSAVIGNILVQDDFLCLGSKLIAQSGAGCPVLQNDVQLAGDLVVEDVVDGCFLGGDGGGVCRGQGLDGGTVDLAVSTFGILDIHVAFGVHEAENFILEFLMGLVRLVHIGFLCAGIVGLQFLTEQLQSMLVVIQQILIGNCACIVGDGGLVAGADGVSNNRCLHGIVGNFFGSGSLHLGVEQVHQLIAAGLGTTCCGRCDQVVGIIGCGADSLGAVLVQAQNVGGVQGVGAGVNGIQIDVVVKQDVFHGQGMTIGELDAVLQNEGVGGGVVGIFDDVVILDDHGFILAVGNFHFAVHIVSAQHADLGHADDGSVRCGGVEERIKQAVQLLGHDNESIHGASAAAAGEGSAHADDHHQAQEQTQNTFFHNCISPL